LTWQKRMGEANFEPGLPRQCGKTTTDQWIWQHDHIAHPRKN
jgi:hypothetical protein